jgi:hypothetical protein
MAGKCQNISLIGSVEEIAGDNKRTRSMKQLAVVGGWRFIETILGTAERLATCRKFAIDKSAVNENALKLKGSKLQRRQGSSSITIKDRCQAYEQQKISGRRL